MSELERHIGKIKKVDLDNYTVEGWCEKKCKSIGLGLGEHYESYKEALLLEPYPAIVIEVDNTLWEVIEDKEEEDTEDMSILIPNNDGTYSYIMQFYNGGTCLSEMLEDGIKNIKEE
jgi:hypothetical protein